jgi:hypothetical protein
MNARTTRIVQVAGVILALLLGTATATALAKHGEDDGPGGTTGTTQTTGTTGTTGTTTTGTTGTTTTPAPAPARRIRVVGIVGASDPAARSFTLKVKNRKPVAKARASKHGRKHRATRTYTVLAGELTIPAVGRQVLVKGTVEGTTITATRIKVLRGDDNPRRSGRDDDRGRGGDDRGDDDRGHGRGGDDSAGDDRGHGRGDDDRGRGDDDRGRGGDDRGRGGDDDRGRGRGGDDD